MNNRPLLWTQFLPITSRHGIITGFHVKYLWIMPWLKNLGDGHGTDRCSTNRAHPTAPSTPPVPLRTLPIGWVYIYFSNLGEARNHVTVECINKPADSLIEIAGTVCYLSQVVVQTSRSLFKLMILDVLVELPWDSFWSENHIYFRCQILLNCQRMDSSVMFWDSRRLEIHSV